MKRIAIAGSTGSIGASALDVIAAHPERFSVAALAAGRNVTRLAGQIRAHRPRLAAVADDASRAALRAELGAEAPEILVGPEGLEAIGACADADVFLSAIVGAAGIRPTWSAVAAGKQVALANKESLVAAGEAILAEAGRTGALILPVDSEHNALHQCLRGGARSEVRRLILTASGGPFRRTPKDAMDRITPQEALRHPTWEMGPKITIDSATLMNKGLEIIEAHWLFGVPGDRIEVVVHPQSTVHSLVEFSDGSLIAQLSETDMRHPIRYALAWPERLGNGAPGIDLTRIGRLEFEAPDRDRFPCLELAEAALAAGGAAPAVLNAANEIAVEAFLAGRIRFPAIAGLVAKTLDLPQPAVPRTLAGFLEADAWGRRAAGDLLSRGAAA